MKKNLAPSEKTKSKPSAFREILRALHEFGVLLESHATLPSVVGLIATSPVRGSWWGHPLANTIFLATRRLTARQDVTTAKLIDGKITYVHRKLWPALVVVGRSLQPWQTERLTRAARWLLSRVRRAHAVRTEELQSPTAVARKLGDAARELETRLLVHSQEVHTKTGAHAKYLETWAHWTNRVGLILPKLTVHQGESQLENALNVLNSTYGAKARMPWSRSGSSAKTSSLRTTSHRK